MSKGPTVTRKGKEITIVLANDGEADHLEVALKHRQWVQVLPEGIKLAQMDEDPKMTDYDVLISGSVAPLFQPGKPGEPVKHVDGGRYNNPHYWSCYVEHIGAGCDWGYERCFKWMVDAGFTLLRSPRGPDGKFWEVWYTPGSSFLKGDLHNCTRQALTERLYHTVRPGNVSFDGERWCLTFGDD